MEVMLIKVNTNVTFKLFDDITSWHYYYFNEFRESNFMSVNVYHCYFVVKRTVESKTAINLTNPFKCSN